MLTSLASANSLAFHPFSRNFFRPESDAANCKPALCVIAIATRLSPACSASPGNSSGVTSMACASENRPGNLRRLPAHLPGPRVAIFAWITCGLRELGSRHFPRAARILPPDAPASLADLLALPAPCARAPGNAAPSLVPNTPSPFA